jgi:hypothetical protein
MTTKISDIKMHRGRKLIFNMITGGVIGYIGMNFALDFLEPKRLGIDQVIAMGVGLIYLMMGLIVGFGAALPNMGSKILNVEDAEEIHDQRRVLLGSAVSMIALGAALMVLALAEPNGFISPLVAFGGLLAALALATGIFIRDRKYYDELMLQLNREAGNLSFCSVGLVILVWASAASLGLISAPTPFALVAIISGGSLLAFFMVAARRGLLALR